MDERAERKVTCPKCKGPAVRTTMPDHLRYLIGDVQAWTCPTCGYLFGHVVEILEQDLASDRERLGAVAWGEAIEREADEACQAATRGPWVATSDEGMKHGRYLHSICRDDDPRGLGEEHRCLGDMEGATEQEARANARFAAVARLALPSAICEIRRLRLALAAWTPRVADLAREARAIADSMREHRPMVLAEYPELPALLDEVAGLARGGPVESEGQDRGSGPEGAGA
jgi:hypothetical protein